MKQTPREDIIQQKMQPGVITMNGFLGTDDRHYHDIISDDELTLSTLQLTADQIADRLEYFTRASVSSYMGPIIIDEIYEVETEIYRGKLPCPFAHPGIHRKTITKLYNMSNHTSLQWTTLNIHLIRAHHFFEGKGSAFRLEPAEIAKTLFNL
jgi:hypothetical protein